MTEGNRLKKKESVCVRTDPELVGLVFAVGDLLLEVAELLLVADALLAEDVHHDGVLALDVARLGRLLPHRLHVRQDRLDQRVLLPTSNVHQPHSDAQSN